MPGAWQPALEQLVTERYGRLVARAMLLTGSRADAEDLVQDALVATFSGRARFRAVEPAEQYVRRAMATRFVDRTRRASRERSALDAAVAGSSDSPTDDLRTEVETAMSRLAPRVRACVYLRHFEGLSVAETAGALGISDGAVKRYTSDGLGELGVLLRARWRSSDGSVPVVPTGEVGRDA